MYSTPGKRDQVCRGKINGKKVYETKKYLLRILNDFLDIHKGCEVTGIQSEESFMNEFGRKLSFRLLYELIKANKQYICNKNIPHANFLCEICKNAVFFMQGLNRSLPKELNLPSNPHDIVEKFSCDSSNQDCTNSKCNNSKLPEKIAESGAFETDDIKFDEWRQADRRVQKVSVSIDVQEVSTRFNLHVRTLKRHILVKRIQHTAFNNVKANLQEKKKILIQVDYSENYTNKGQGQVQSAYFGYKSFSIFAACCYLEVHGVILNENEQGTSDANDHSRSAAMSCWKKVYSYVREKYRLQESLILCFWSDGCSEQFHSRFVFFLLSRFELEHTIFWYYNERHHGNEPMDGVGGTMKHRVFRDVKIG